MQPQILSHWPSWPLPIASLRERLTVTARDVCSYLPERLSVFRAFEANALTGGDYQQLMDAGFRRSGSLIYQPMCPGCRRCVPMRVPTHAFAPTKSQRRVLRRNDDLSVRIAPPQPTAEKWELYDRYQHQWHDGQQAGDPASFVTFLYRSPVEALEFEYRDPAGTLLGVGICDRCPNSLSSVYFYFDPAQHRRSLGTFSALYELAWARQNQLGHWYAGYWVRGCATMEYKSRFGPAEFLGTDGVWRVTTKGKSPGPPPA